MSCCTNCTGGLLFRLRNCVQSITLPTSSARCSSSAEKKTKTQDHPTHRCWFSVRDPPKKFGSCQTLDMSICTEQRGRNMKHGSWLFLLRRKNRQKIRNHEVSLPNRNVFRADQVYSFLFASFACSVG